MSNREGKLRARQPLFEGGLGGPGNPSWEQFGLGGTACIPIQAHPLYTQPSRGRTSYIVCGRHLSLRTGNGRQVRAPALPCPPACHFLPSFSWKARKNNGVSLGLNPKRNRFGWLTVSRLSQLVAIIRCTQHNLVARHIIA